MNQKIIIILIAVAVLFVGGIWFALLLPDTTYQQNGTSPGNTTAVYISDLRIGTPVRPEFASQQNPPIKQKTEYTVHEPIMLRATTADDAEDAVSVQVRLINETSSIVSLNPSTVSFEPGTNSFCCWTVDTPGQYTMQVFRPNGAVTTLPLKIVKDYATLSQ